MFKIKTLYGLYCSVLYFVTINADSLNYLGIVVPYTIRLHPVNLLQHWGLIAAHLFGGFNCPTVLI